MWGVEWGDPKPIQSPKQTHTRRTCKSQPTPTQPPPPTHKAHRIPTQNPPKTHTNATQNPWKSAHETDTTPAQNPRKHHATPVPTPARNSDKIPKYPTKPTYSRADHEARPGQQTHPKATQKPRTVQHPRKTHKKPCAAGQSANVVVVFVFVVIPRAMEFLHAVRIHTELPSISKFTFWWAAARIQGHNPAWGARRLQGNQSIFVSRSLVAADCHRFEQSKKVACCCRRILQSGPTHVESCVELIARSPNFVPASPRRRCQLL